MADSIAICCYGSGFDSKHRVCIYHLRQAYEHAICEKDYELAAVILLKQRELTAGATK